MSETGEIENRLLKLNADLNRFEGEIKLNLNGKKVKSAMNHKNLLLRATKLKNTEWVVGITVYTS